jgi:hypothetical protein
MTIRLNVVAGSIVHWQLSLEPESGPESEGLAQDTLGCAEVEVTV